MTFEPISLSAEQTGRIVTALRLPPDTKGVTVPELVQMLETRLLAAAELEKTVSLSMGKKSGFETADDRAYDDAAAFAKKMNRGGN